MVTSKMAVKKLITTRPSLPILLRAVPKSRQKKTSPKVFVPGRVLITRMRSGMALSSPGAVGNSL